MDNNQLLAYARLNYPVGTKFYPAHLVWDKECTNYLIVTNKDVLEICGSTIVSTFEGKQWTQNPIAGTEIFNRNLYYNGRWARIIESVNKNYELWK